MWHINPFDFTNSKQEVSEHLPHAWLVCDSQAFIAMLRFDPSKSVLPIIPENHRTQ